MQRRASTKTEANADLRGVGGRRLENWAGWTPGSGFCRIELKQCGFQLAKTKLGSEKSRGGGS